MQRQSVVTLLAQVHTSEDVDEMMPYTTDANERGYAEAKDWIAAQDKQSCEDACLTQLRHAMSATEIAQLQDIHPAWMVELLKNESPRVIGILLRYVPSRHVRYIMDRLPSHVRDQIPSVVDAFSVPLPVVQMLRRRFESCFESAVASLSIVPTEFDQVNALGFDELPALIHDLGLQELALAFVDADPRSLQILFNRLSSNDARQLRERIRQMGSAPASLIRDAKYTILELSTETIPSDQFIAEIGFHAFAKAFGAGDAHLIASLRYKVEPRLGALLEQKRGGGTADRKQMLMDRLVVLSRAGILDAKWQLLSRPVADAVHTDDATNIPLQNTPSATVKTTI